MSTVKTHEQQSLPPGSFNEFQQQLKDQNYIQVQPIINRYTQALAEGSFEGSLEEFERTQNHEEETVVVNALTAYTEALKTFRDSQVGSLPTEA